MKVDPPPVNKIDVGVADEQPPSPREAPEGARTFASAPPPAARGEPKKDPRTEETDGSDGSKDGEEEEEKEPDVCSIAELFQFADGVDIALMIVGSIAAAFAGAGMPAFSEVFGRLMNELSSNDLSTVEDRVGDVAFIMFLIGIAIFVLSAIFVACWMVAAERQSARIREKFFEALMRQECAFHDENKPGGLAARLTGDTKVIKVGINDKVALGIMNMFMFFTGFGLGFYRSWELTLLMLGTLPFIAAGGAVISIIATQMASSSRTYFAKAGEISDEVLSNVKTVQVFGNEEKEVERFSRELDGASWANTRKEFMSLGGVGVTYAIMFLSYALAFWFSSVLIDKGRNNAGEIVTVFFAVMMGSFGLGLAMPTFSALADARGAAFKVLEVIKRDTLIDVDTPGKSKLSQFDGQVQFKNVRFSYPTRKDTTLFTDLNLTVTAGSTVAFAGASGCGKSSLIALAQRQYDPDAGTVEIDGVDLKDLDLRWWRDQVGVVSQEPNLFSGSVADNVRVGKPDATQAEVEAACKQADIHHTIMGLPDQYETSVGAVGSQLSGGQKQRLAIARAIVKDPKFLILDEATSALDRKSEVEVQTALDKLMAGDGSSKKRTVFVIAHRLVTIQNVDKIYFVTHDDVSGSAIAESGSFSELMAMNGLFAHMVSKQGKSGLGVIGEGAQGTSSSSDDDATGGAATGADGSPAKPTKTPLSARNRRGSFVGQDPEKPDKKETLEEAAKREVEETDVPTLRLLHMTAEKWWSIVLGLIGSVLSGGLFPAYAVVFSKMLKVLAQGSADEVRDDAPFWAYMFIAIAAAAFIGWSMQGFYAFAGEFLTHKLRVALLRNLLRQDATFFDTPNRDASSLCAVLSGDCEAIHLLWGPALGYKVQMACNLIVGITLGLVHSWRVALVTMAGLPLVIVSGMIQQVALAGFGTAGESPEDQIVLESLANIRTVHAFNQDRIRHQNYVEAVAEGKKAGIRTGLIAGFAYGFSQFAIYGVFALSFWYGGKLIGQGKVNFEDMMIASMAVLMSAMGAGEAGGFAAKAADAGPAAQRVFALVDRKPGIDVLDDGDTSISLTKGADIDFTHVSFSYPSRPDSKILKKFSDHFGSGHAIGLMGSTGCGKSTIVQLLARYYDPGHGHILIDGKDLRSIDLKTWRKALSVVSQEPSLFSGTVIDNIRYACPDAKDDEVFRVAKLAAIHDDILGMEKGYDTEVGYKGKMLSGGQKQRVAIARGLLRKPKLLLLDEATSALDPATEAKVQEGIATACKEGHTTVVSVAHRLTTIQDSNKIVLLDNGVVLEEGTHAELMAMDGDYCARYQQYTAKS